MFGRPTPNAETIRIAPIVSRILAELGASLRPGLRTKELEALASERLQAADLKSRMLGFRGFPAAIAVSIDDEIVHGIPSDRELREGQLVKIQVGGRTQRGTADQGWSFPVVAVSEEKMRLRAAGIYALQSVIASLRAGARTGDVGAVIQGTLEAAGFSAIRDYVGYGIGERPMQDPQLPCVGTRGTGSRIQDGTVLHVHVIGAAGSHETVTKPDGWTAATRDGRPSVLVTAVVHVHANGCDVLTPLLS